MECKDLPHLKVLQFSAFISTLKHIVASEKLGLLAFAVLKLNMQAVFNSHLHLLSKSYHINNMKQAKSKTTTETHKLHLILSDHSFLNLLIWHMFTSYQRRSSPTQKPKGWVCLVRCKSSYE